MTPRRWRRLCLALAASALAGAAMPAMAGAASPGVVLFGPNHLRDGTFPEVQASGARNVRVFVSWRSLEERRGQFSPTVIAAFDELVTRLRGLGVNVYFVVHQTPAWATPSGAANAPPPRDAYADFVQRLAEHFRGQVMAYEIWNEPNGGTFWAGGASPAQYAELLTSAYTAVKAGDAAAKVGVGGLVGNDYNYVEGLYGAGAKGSFDFVAIHTDNACSFTDPRNAARDVDGRISRWSFTGYREIRATMVAHGDPKPIWMTEMGWQVTGQRCPAKASDPGGVDGASQAAFLTRAYACLANDPYVEVASWFSMVDFGTTYDTGAGYGLWEIGGAARPALAAFRQAESLAADRACGLQVDAGAAGISVASPTGATGVSGDLVYRATATDDQGVRTLAILVDGRQIRVTSRRVLSGTWSGWRSLRPGPHTVTFKAVDLGRHVSTKDVTVNRVPYGSGEAVATRIGLQLYGSGPSRVAAGRLYTLPRVAKPFLRGQLTLAFERQAGSRWVPFGAATAGAASSSRAIQRQQQFKPGRYRLVIAFAGYQSFRPAVARRSFTIG